MDNDSRILKLIKRTVRRAEFAWSYRDIRILSEKDGNQKIKDAIQAGNPFAAIRGGATELRTIAEYLKEEPFSDKIKKEIFELSGVFPATDENLKKFCEYYIDCMKEADLLALWGVGAESQVVHQYCDSTYMHLRALEPYYFDAPWSGALKGKKVLVLHPFTETIRKQYEKREKLFPRPDILPEFKTLSTVQAVQSIAGEQTEFSTWFDALHSMEQALEQADFDIAIIGAGAYGLPLAIHCKKMGKQAIQMAGATQLLFGIKGKRWDNHPIISGLYNDSWVRPEKNETPQHKEKVEGGSYW